MFFSMKLPFMCEQMCCELIALFCMLIVGCPIEISCFPQLSRVNLVNGLDDCSIPHSLFGGLFIKLLLLIQRIYCH